MTAMERDDIVSRLPDAVVVDISDGHRLLSPGPCGAGDEQQGEETDSCNMFHTH